MPVVSRAPRKVSWQKAAQVVNLLDLLAERENEIGARLEELRKAHGLSQEAAAHKVGVSYRQWQRWEAGGEPRGSTLTRVAEGFGISVSELVEGTQPKSQLDRIEAMLTELLERLAVDDVLRAAAQDNPPAQRQRLAERRRRAS